MQINRARLRTEPHRPTQQWAHRFLSGLVLTIAAVLASISAAAAYAAAADLSASARASVAQALYAASATSAAAERAADTRIAEQRRQIEAMQTQLKASAGRDASTQARAREVQTQLVQAQERFVEQLAERDRAYAREIAVFRSAVQDIASTPEGEAALRQFNAGDEVGALSVLDRLVDARERARKVRADIETAAERRRVATLALDARDKGKLDTQAVIARYEEVTRLDPGLHWDWVELGRLYTDAGKLPQARQAAERAAQSAANNRDRSVALNEFGDVLVAQGDLAGARSRYQDSLDIAKRLAAADPSSASLQRDVSVSLNNLGDVLAAQGDLAGARSRYQDSLDIRKRLAAADHSSASLQRDVSVSLDKLGNVLVAQGDLAGARSRYQDSLDIRKRLAVADPSSASLQRDLVVSYVKQSEVTGEKSHLQAALSLALSMRDRGQLAPRDAWMIDDLKRKLGP